MKRFLSSAPLLYDEGLALLRIVTGAFMIYHGYEVFLPDKMKGYEQWLGDIRFPSPSLMAYLGKGAEFVGGLLLAIGLLTRFAAITLAVTMAVISFGLGKGRIFMEEQHPFLFVLIAVLFLFTGAGKWSLDHVLFEKKPNAGIK